MELVLRRIANDSESTSGYMLCNGVFMCFTLEDQFNFPKVPKETRIPAGDYKVGFKETPTPLTMKYRSKYNWFNFHLEVKDVEDFHSVYIHVGNTEKHTDGCILVGDSLTNQGSKDDFLGYSTKAFERVYNKIADALEKGQSVTLSILDR